MHDYRLAVTIHGDDVLAHNNWEISEAWLSRYKYVPSPLRLLVAESHRCLRFLVDPTTLNITNKWRKERGEPELHVSEYSTEQPTNV